MKLKTLHLLPLAVAALGATLGLRAAAPSAAATDKADYIFLEAAAAFTDERYDDYYYLLRRAAQLNPADTFTAAKIAELELLMPTSDSIMRQKAYDAVKARYLAEPTNDVYASMFAGIASQAGNIDDVIGVWQKLDSLQPQKNDPAMNLAGALIAKYSRSLDMGSFDRAMDIYNRIESRMGPTPQLAFRKISALLMRNDTTAVIDEARKLAAAAPADIEALLLAGNVYDHLSMPDSALAFYNKAAEIDPENGSVYLTRAEFFGEQGDSVAYDREVFRALESQELDFDRKFELLTGYVSKLYTDTLQWPRIGEMFAVLQDINPGEARLHDFYSAYKSAIGQKEQAAEQLTYSIALDPNDPRRWQDLTVLYFTLNDTAKALETAREAEAIYPERGSFRFMEVSALMMQDKKLEALARLEGIDTLQFENPVLESNAYATRGDLLSALDSIEPASKAYKKAIDINPDNYMAMNNWAYFSAERGVDLDAAELYASIATAAEPENGTYADTYAWVLFKKKDYEKARVEMDRTLRLYGLIEPDSTAVDTPETTTETEEPEEQQEPSPDIYDHAGDIYFWTHEPQKAVEFWKEALKFDPDNEIIKKKVRHRTYFFE